MIVRNFLRGVKEMYGCPRKPCSYIYKLGLQKAKAEQVK